MSLLGGGKSPFHDDDGSADPRAQALLAAFGSGLGSEHDALTALAASRLLVPIVAAPSESGDQGDHGDHGAEMSLPTLIGRDGRPAIPAFTCLDTLARWDPRARPVPALAPTVWRAAVDSSTAVVVDVAGPVPLAIEGARLTALADGQPVPLPHQDPDVLAVVREAAAGRPEIAGIRLAAGSDLQLELTLADGCDPAVGQEVARQLGGELMERLGARLRRGITVAVMRSGGHRDL